MAQADKKNQFKFLIQEFQTQTLPEAYPRDLAVPLTSDKIVAVYGPRRIGKSYYFYTLIQKLLAAGVAKDRILYVNFEDDRILPLKAEELNALVEAYFELYPENKEREIYLFFDEIQNVTSWEPFVRRIHDKERVKIFLTGSSSRLHSQEIATSLRGRTIHFGLYPLSFREYVSFKGMKLEKNLEYTAQRFKIKKALEDYLEHGGFPEVVLQDNDLIRNKILEEYFESLVLRDLGERHRVENTALLRDLLKYLFACSACLFSVNAYYKVVRQSMPASRQKIMDYLRWIQETGYFSLLPKFSWSLKEQRVNPQKIVCLDLGIRNRLIFRFSKDEGKAVENLVGAMLTRGDETVYYWKGQQEVDFVIPDRGDLRAINVSYGSSVPDREIRSLLEFQKRFKRAEGLLLITKDAEEKRKRVKLLPLWKWLLFKKESQTFN